MKKLLFVGGEAPLLNEIKKGLKDSGHETHIAYQRDEGLMMAREARPDLIFLNVHGPASAAANQLKAFRLDEVIGGIPVIILCGKISGHDDLKNLIREADGHIEKPFDLKHLLHVIEHAPAASARALPSEGRRKAPRVHKDIEIDFKMVNSLDGYQLGRTENISPQGLMIEAVYKDRPLVKGQYFEIVLKEAGPERPVKVLGQVVWVEHGSFTFNTRIGLKLISVVEGDAGRLKDYIR